MNTYLISDTAIYIAADASDRQKVFNVSGGTIYYKATSDVDSGDTAVTVGSSVTLSDGAYFISASTSRVSVNRVTELGGEDLVTQAELAAGPLAPTAGIDASGGLTGVCNVPVTAVGVGTDTAGANGTVQVTSIFVPANMTVTNINYMIGATGGTNKVEAALYDATGALVANTEAAAATTVGTAKQIQTVPLTATADIVGPATYYVGVGYNGNTATIYTVPAHLSNGIFAGSVSQTFGTFAKITPPSSFTADKAPYVFLS